MGKLWPLTLRWNKYQIAKKNSFFPLPNCKDNPLFHLLRKKVCMFVKHFFLSAHKWRNCKWTNWSVHLFEKDENKDNYLIWRPFRWPSHEQYFIRMNNNVEKMKGVTRYITCLIVKIPYQVVLLNRTTNGLIILFHIWKAWHGGMTW